MGRLVCTVNCDGSVNGKDHSDLPERLQHPSFLNSFKLNVCQIARRAQCRHSSCPTRLHCILHISNVAVSHVNGKKSLHKQTFKFWSNYSAYLSLLMYIFFFVWAQPQPFSSLSVFIALCAFFSMRRQMDHSSIKVPRSHVSRRCAESLVLDLFVLVRGSCIMLSGTEDELVRSWGVSLLCVFIWICPSIS